MKKIIIFIFSIMLIMLTAAGCAEKEENLTPVLAGTWYVDGDSNSVLELREDGTFRSSAPETEGTWKLSGSIYLELSSATGKADVFSIKQIYVDHLDFAGESGTFALYQNPITEVAAPGINEKSDGVHSETDAKEETTVMSVEQENHSENLAERRDESAEQENYAESLAENKNESAEQVIESGDNKDPEEGTSQTSDIQKPDTETQNNDESENISGMKNDLFTFLGVACEEAIAHFPEIQQNVNPVTGYSTFRVYVPPINEGAADIYMEEGEKHDICRIELSSENENYTILNINNRTSIDEAKSILSANGFQFAQIGRTEGNVTVWARYENDNLTISLVTDAHPNIDENGEFRLSSEEDIPAIANIVLTSVYYKRPEEASAESTVNLAGYMGKTVAELLEVVPDDFVYDERIHSFNYIVKDENGVCIKYVNLDSGQDGQRISWVSTDSADGDYSIYGIQRGTTVSDAIEYIEQEGYSFQKIIIPEYDPGCSLRFTNGKYTIDIGSSQVYPGDPAMAQVTDIDLKESVLDVSMIAFDEFDF